MLRILGTCSCGKKKDNYHFVMSYSLTHNSCIWSMIDWYSCDSWNDNEHNTWLKLMESCCDHR
jgi:hypothetical protein